jgi:hypothetical protein
MVRQRQHGRVDERTTREGGLVQSSFLAVCGEVGGIAAMMRRMTLTHLVVLVGLT